MTINTTVLFIFLSIFYLLVPVLVLFFVRNEKLYKIIFGVCVALFIVALIIGVFGEIDINQKTTYIGFDFSGEFCNKQINFKFKTTKIDKFINLVMLIPIGEAICMQSKRRGHKWGILFALLIGALVGVGIETLQFILPIPRSVQLSDAVYNLISVIIGYLYLSAFYYLKKLIQLLVFKRKSMGNNKSTELDK